MDEPKIVTTIWNAADYIETPEDVVEFLKATLEDSDPRLLADAPGIVARSEGITVLAERAGVRRESLVQAPPGNNPELATLLKIVEVMGLRLDLRAKHPDPVPV